MSTLWRRLNLFRCVPLTRELSSRIIEIHNRTGQRLVHRQARFKTIDGAVDIKSATYQKNAANTSKLIDRFKTILRLATAGGGEKAIERHVTKNKKLLVRDRLALLFDNAEDVLELSPLAGMGMKYGDIPRAGIVCAIGKVCGIYCMVVANDATVKAGTLYPISVKKQIHSLEVSIQNAIPCVCVVDSGGAFLPMQAEIFPDRMTGGRTFYNESVINSMDIPQLAIVCGSCTAGAAYVPTMAQEAIIVDKIGTIFLGGPPLVKAALGELVTPDELGGATLHCNVSGCTDYFAKTEQEAFELGRASVAAFNIEPVVTHTNVEEPTFDPSELLGIISPENNSNIDMYKVIARIVDGSAMHEFKATYGPTIITGFCHIKGYLVGVVANNGIMSGDAALKAAHFVQLCSQRNVPLIFLQNVVLSDSLTNAYDQAVDNGNKIRNQSKFMSSVACAGVPMLTVVVGNSYGVESYMMGGRSFSPRFLFCWPNAKVCITDPDHLAMTIVKDEMERLQDHLDNNKVAELEKSVLEKCKLQSSAFYSSAQAWDDGIILPQDTRKVLGQCLEIIHQDPRLRHYSDSPPKAVLRM